MNRQTWGVIIIVAWLGTIGWLLTRQLGQPSGLALADATRAVEPGAMYYTVSMGDVQIGFASNMVDTVPDGLVVEDRMLLEVPALGAIQRTEVRTIANLTNALRLLSFQAGMTTADGRFAARGTVSGDSVLTVELESAGSQQTIRVPINEPIVLPAYMPLRVAFGDDLEVGNTYSLRTFDPLLLQHSDVSVRVVDDSILFVPDSSAFDSTAMTWVVARWDTVPAWRIEQTVNGVLLDSWIDGFGRVVSVSSPLGLRVERTAFELAFLNFQDRDRDESMAGFGEADIIRQTAIASHVTLAANRVEFRVVLSDVDPQAFDLVGGRQSMSGDTLIVRRETAQSLDADYRIPLGGRPDLNRYVSPEPLIQSSDPRIQAQARQIIGRRRDPEQVARLLSDWVYRELDKRVTLAMPSAVEMLRTRQGDCNEHAILFVALARAVGLPARTAAGLAYIDGSFYYHAWSEVYLGEWVAVDPTFGQFPADASHLRFTIGGLARQIELIRVIGRVSLNVVEAGE